MNCERLNCASPFPEHRPKFNGYFEFSTIWKNVRTIQLVSVFGWIKEEKIWKKNIFLKIQSKKNIKN